MIKILLIFIALFFTACMNKHGVSAKYYSDCDEYYDLQGYYHQECGKDDIMTYQRIGEKIIKAKDKVKNYINDEEEVVVKPNVW